ncbi:MAG TPA: hypothetical protein VII84_09205 [Acidimicrobiales bacterium]
MSRLPPLPHDLFDQWRGLLKDTVVPSWRRVALTIWCVVLPLSANRGGLPGDIS